MSCDKVNELRAILAKLIENSEAEKIESSKTDEDFRSVQAMFCMI